MKIKYYHRHGVKTLDFQGENIKAKIDVSNLEEGKNYQLDIGATPCFDDTGIRGQVAGDQVYISIHCH